MTTNSLSAEAGCPQGRRSPRSMRWAVLLVASILLHVVAFNWADGRIGIPSWRAQQQPVIMTELHAAPAATPAPAAPLPALATPKRQAKPRRRAAAPPRSSPPAAMPPLVDASVALALPATEAADGVTDPDAAAEPAAASAPSPVAPPASVPPTEENKPQATAALRYKVSPPPSAELKYEVQALREGQTWHGAGMFRWQAAGDSYSVSAEASVTILFKITVLNFKSEGAINDFGLAPVLYSEKPFHKSLTNTHFQHDKRKISFSASEAVYPYNGGEQDRASIIWQLSAIGRGDPGQFTPGAEFDVMVAGTRDADTWRIRVNGQEEIETAYGKLNAWHVVRMPRPGSFDQTIDIWLAPQQEWYPAKVRYTYTNGDYIDLSLAAVAPGGAH